MLKPVMTWPVEVSAFGADEFQEGHQRILTKIQRAPSMIHLIGAGYQTSLSFP
jgi:hypothetical protein